MTVDNEVANADEGDHAIAISMHSICLSCPTLESCQSCYTWHDSIMQALTGCSCGLTSICYCTGLPQVAQTHRTTLPVRRSELTVRVRHTTPRGQGAERFADGGYKELTASARDPCNMTHLSDLLLDVFCFPLFLRGRGRCSLAFA